MGGVSGAYAGTDLGPAYPYAAPGTPVDHVIVRPYNETIARPFWYLFGRVADSPVTDPGVGMAIEQALQGGPPPLMAAGRVLGRALAQGVGTMVETQFRLGAGAAAAPANSAIRTAQGIQYAFDDPVGAARATIMSLDPRTWGDSDLIRAFRDGDALAVGMHGGSLMIETGGTLAGGSAVRVPRGNPRPMFVTNGGHAPQALAIKPYANPANRPRYGVGQVDEVWANAQHNGRVFDPNTGDLLTWDRSRPRAGQWDMGHLPGREYRVLHGRYMNGEISLRQFLQEYRDSANYRPELPSANRSRIYENR